MLVNVSVDNITMPTMYTRTPPNKDKINTHMMYYLEHGTFKHSIVVTQKGMLVDGYCDYIVAVVCGIDSVRCEVNTKKLKYGIERNRNIKNKSHKRKILYHRQGGKCAMCGMQLQIENNTSIEDYLTFDHILPVCRGGSNGLMNLQGLCRRCNYRKNDKMEVLENENINS